MTRLLAQSRFLSQDDLVLLVEKGIVHVPGECARRLAETQLRSFVAKEKEKCTPQKAAAHCLMEFASSCGMPVA